MTISREINSHGISHIDELGNMHFEDGRIWQRGKCYNSIVNGCMRDADWYTGGVSYCAQCAAEYDAEIENEKQRERFARLCSDFESIRLLPRDFKHYKAPALYPWQASALTSINSDYARNVWLWGAHGNGKTEVGKIVLLSALRNGVSAAYIDCAGTGLSEITTHHNARIGAVRARLLVLDDISKMLITDYSAGEIHNILSERHQQKLRTIVLSEKSGKDFALALADKTEHRFGASTVDRLNTKGHPVLSIEMQGDNLRRKTSVNG